MSKFSQPAMNPQSSKQDFKVRTLLKLNKIRKLPATKVMTWIALLFWPPMNLNLLHTTFVTRFLSAVGMGKTKQWLQ